MNKGDSQNCGRTSEGRLDEFTQVFFALIKQCSAYPGNGDTKEGDKKTVQDIFGIPYGIEVALCNVTKQEQRQCNFEIKGIQRFDKGFIHNTSLFQYITDYH